MLKVENYPNAYKEVYVILKKMKKDDVRLIPKDYINLIMQNMNREYKFELKENTELENQNILRETKAILADIYYKYWATDTQRAKIKEVFRQDIIKEEEAKPKYNPDELFKNKKVNIVKPEENVEEVQMIEYKKENIITKFINRIKSLFKRK